MNIQFSSQKSYDGMMKNTLSYLTPEGHTVFTSEYLQNRGTCCKSACLHCPYGFTLKKHGLQFEPFQNEHTEFVESLVGTFDWKTFSPENILLMSLKGVQCGVVFKNHIVVKKLFTKAEFEKQGLSRELVESYIFI